MKNLKTTVVAITFGFLSLSALADSLVSETGQTRCFDTLVEIICSGTGQDGDLRAGVKWPTPRFTDNGNGTVTDHLTGLVWVQWVLCFQGDWSAALSHANGLAAGTCGVADGSVPGDWRLPNIRELSSLTDYGENGPALPAGHPFTSVGGPSLWSSTTDIRNTPRVFRLTLSDGGISFADKIGNSSYAWAVRDALPPPTQCSDDIDNDGDGLIDLDDRQCKSPDQKSEKHPNR
jgi:hypothetical protein